MLTTYKSWTGAINAAKVIAAQDATTKANNAQITAVSIANTLASSARTNAFNDIVTNNNLVVNSLTVNTYSAVFNSGIETVVPNNGSGNITGRTSSGFWQYSTASKAMGWPNDDNNWYHLITTTHNNKSLYYSLQLSSSFFDNSELYWRSTNNNGNTAWNRVWSSANFDPNTKAEFNKFAQFSTMTIGSATATYPNININGVSTTDRFIVFSSANKNRWSIGSDARSETGSNEGSDFNITRYNDDGSYIGTSLNVIRKTGLVTLNNGATVYSQLFVQGSAIFNDGGGTGVGSLTVRCFSDPSKDWRFSNVNGKFSIDRSNNTQTFDINAVTNVNSQLNVHNGLLNIGISPSHGGLQLQSSDVNHSGYMEFFRGNNPTRDGYIGYSDGTTINIVADTGYYNFNGAIVPKINYKDIWYGGNFDPNTKATLGGYPNFTNIQIGNSGVLLYTDDNKSFNIRTGDISTGNFNYTKANADGSWIFRDIHASGASFGSLSAINNDGTLFLDSTGSASNTYRVKQITTSPNVDNGNSWLFRSTRPSDGNYRDVILKAISGEILTHRSGYYVSSFVSMNTYFIPAVINNVYVGGYSNEYDDGGAWYRRRLGDYDHQHGLCYDAYGGQWILSSPTTVYVEAFGIINGDATGAFQRAANTGVINLMAKDYQITGTIYSGGGGYGNTKNSLRVSGALKGLTRIIFIHTGDCFSHGFIWDNSPNNNNPPVDSPFYMDNVTIIASAGVNLPTDVYTSGPNTGANVHFLASHYAIAIRQNGNWGDFSLRDVSIRSFDGRSAWSSAIYAEGITFTNFYNVRVDGGSYVGTALELSRNMQVAFDIRCNDLSSIPYSQRGKYKAFVFNVENTDLSAVLHGIRLTIAGDGSTLEGGQFHKCGGRTVNGAWFRLQCDNPNWYAPYFTFSHCNTEGPGQFVDIDSISELHISHCLLYLSPNGFAPTYTNFINVRACRQGYIHHNSIIVRSTAKVNYLMYFGPNSTNVFVNNNNLECDRYGSNDFVVNALLVCDSNNINMRAHYNNRTNIPSSTVQIAGPWQYLD